MHSKTFHTASPSSAKKKYKTLKRLIATLNPTEINYSKTLLRSF
jgi:hypothetical protein